MPRTFRFNGETHEFPDGVSDAQIVQALGAKSGDSLEEISRGVESPGQDYGSRMAQAAPAGAVHSIVGAPGALVDLAGFAVKSSLQPSILIPGMKSAGEAVANPSETWDRLVEWVKNNPEAVGELAGGTAAAALPWGTAARAALGRFAPALRESALQTYARIGESGGGTKETAEIANKLRPIQKDLPVISPISRKRLVDFADRGLEKAGPKVEEVMNTSDPSTFKLAEDATRAEGREGIAYGEHEAQIGTDASGNPIMKMQSPTYKTEYAESVASAAKKQADRLRNLEKVAVDIQGSPTRGDVWKVRKALDDAIKVTKGEGAYEVGTRELKPEVRAQMAARTGISKTLHGAEFGAGEAGKEADEMFSAYQTAKDIGETKDAGTFLFRWILSGLLRGPAGTIAGGVSSHPSFWLSLSSVAKRGIADALEAGDKATALKILRTGTVGAAAEDATESTR